MDGSSSLSKKWYASIKILCFLSTLFIALELMQSSNAFASSADSGYQFGKARGLDSASVSVVRLVAGYNAVPAIAGCTRSVIGLGVLVGSWATTRGSTTFSNCVFSVVSLVDVCCILCGVVYPVELLIIIEL